MSILYAMLLQAWSTIKAYPGQWLQPIVFSTLIILLLTFGSDPTALRTGWGPSAIWVACLLSLWYTTEQWFHRALDEGTLEPWLSSPIPLAYLLALQTGILWVIYALPLVLLSPVWCLLLGVPTHYWLPLGIALAGGTLALQYINLIGVALTLGLRRGGLFLPLLLFPLYVPVVIFATTGIQMVGIDGNIWASFALLAAYALGAITVAPPIAAWALRVSLW